MIVRCHAARARRAAFVIVAGAGLIAMSLGGCTREVVSVSVPLFQNVPGAMIDDKPLSAYRRDAAADRDDAAADAGDADLIAEPPARVTENEDGSVTLVSPTVRDLLLNVLYVIEAHDPDLFYRFILSDLTKREYTDRGMDPRAAFAAVKRRARDVKRLVSKLPGGEFTPGVYMTPQGFGVYRLRVGRERDLFWKGIDTRYEHPSWKLRWFVR